MCGICGFNWENKELIKGMAESIAHRGPDDEGFHVDKNVSLGHRRLSILDLSEKGHQPMSNKERTLWIVHNGEIYNFKEIRADLEKKGYVFYSNADTEVIIYAYQEWGEKCLEIFNGMFAFCIYDPNKNSLFLARDRIGIKPLYYYWDEKEKRFMFASEIKAILQDKKVKRKLNKNALVDYFTFQNILDDKTLFENIHMLPPGSFIILKKNRITIKKYWDIDFKQKSNKKIDETLNEFREIFDRAVKRHLISDVEVGSYLSGGFDSPSVAAIAAKHMKDKKMNTFTGKFREKGKYDETKCSRVIAKKINANIYETEITPENFLEGINKVVYHLDEPKVGIPALSQYYVSKLVSNYVKVVLTGHAGDELFAGYPVYKAYYFKSLLKKNPLNIFRLFNFFKLTEIPRSAYYLFFPFIYPETKYGIFIMFSKRQRKKLFTQKFYEQIKNYEPTKSADIFMHKNDDDIDNLQRIYIKTYLPSLLLVEDKMGMAHSIEARIPLCDNELVEFSIRTPVKSKLHNKNLKFIIKESMRDVLPSIFYEQPKKGFPTPFSVWLKKELKEYAYDLLLDEKTIKRGIFNPKFVKKLLDKHCSSKTDLLMDLVNSSRIWGLINIELWFRIFIDQDRGIIKEFA